MAYALVGSAGTYTTGTGATPPFGQATTANNLLICWAGCTSASTGTITPPAGWSTAVSITFHTYIFYKVAAGGDAAPALTSSVAIGAQCAEFSGNATASPVDQIGSIQGTATPTTGTSGAADAASGELIVLLGKALYTTTATRTSTATLNNATTISHNHNDSGNSQSIFLDFAYAFGTSNSAADAYTQTMSTGTKLTENYLLLGSFKLLPPVTPLPGRTISQAINRVATY